MALTAVPTVRGAYRLVGQFRGETWPSAWKWHLATSATALDKTIVTLSEATQASGGGYSTSGYDLAQNSTDFPTWDWFDGVAQIGSFEGGYVFTKQLSITASGGSITYRYWLLCDANVTVGDREVYLIGDEGADRVISGTGTFDIEIRVPVT